MPCLPVGATDCTAHTCDTGSSVASSRRTTCSHASTTADLTPHAPTPRRHFMLAATNCTNHRCPGAVAGTRFQNDVNAASSLSRNTPPHAASKRLSASS